MADEDVFGRCLAFGHRLARRSATAVVDVPGGFAVPNARFPGSYEHNRVVTTDAAADASAVLRAADRVLGGAGLPYRRVDVETVGDAGNLLAGLAEDSRLHHATELVMNTSREVTAPVGSRVREVAFDVLRDAVRDAWRRDLPGADPSTVDQLVERNAATARACQLTHLTIVEDDTAVSWCHLRRAGATAEIDGVSTVPAYRGRGYARAVVADATRVAREYGCDVVFLRAAADDWPQHLYRRLGFRDVGAAQVFQTPP